LQEPLWSLPEQAMPGEYFHQSPFRSPPSTVLNV